MDCLRGPVVTESTVHYCTILDTYEAITTYLNYTSSLIYNFLRCCLTSLLFISICLVFIFSVFIIILVEGNVRGFFENVLKRLLYMVKITKWPIVKDIGHV